MKKTFRDLNVVMDLLEVLHNNCTNYSLTFKCGWHQVDGYNSEWTFELDQHDLVDALLNVNACRKI